MFNRILPAILLALLVSACGTTGSTRTKVPQTPEEAITQRAQERWKLIVAGDFKSAYEYLTPGARAVMSLDAYAGRLGMAQIKWTGSTVDWVKCEDADTCQAQVAVDTLITVPGTGQGQVPGQTRLVESWLRSDGQWYFLPSRIQ